MEATFTAKLPQFVKKNQATRKKVNCLNNFMHSIKSFNLFVKIFLEKKNPNQLNLQSLKTIEEPTTVIIIFSLFKKN